MSTERRPTGSLESEVLDQVWRAPNGLKPRDVLEQIDGDLAYTTVMTILNRLWKKGFLERVKDGRAYRYIALRTESEVIAERMSSALLVAGDRHASLAQFVKELDPADEAHLRSLLRRAE